MFDLFGRYQALIKKIVRQKTGDINPDLEQEIFIRLWQKQNKYIEQGKEKSWVCVIANRICLDFFKSKAYHQQQKSIELIEALCEENKTPEMIFSEKERQQIILAAVNSLPNKLRQVILLQEYEDMSLEQIASKLNIPIGTVKSRIFNARNILADRLFFLKPKNS